MESHLDIKRAGWKFCLPYEPLLTTKPPPETMRRVFHRWLAVARIRRQKRLILHEKEVEFDRATLQVAWDRWREILINEKLRPVVSPLEVPLFEY